MSIKVTSSADTEKKIIDQELEIAVEKLRANPADISIIQEINNIRVIKMGSNGSLNTETASTNFESSNDAQLSSTNTETSNNKDSSEHSSRRLNDDNQNNSYFQMVRNRDFQWMDATNNSLAINVIHVMYGNKQLTSINYGLVELFTEDFGCHFDTATDEIDTMKTILTHKHH
ncbi:unnamed protein product [Rotaria sordida]|uniref:Uncharacterized protein n=1 Tax=Rotaria sordida TaxID=392033 RepID=A0A814QP78_9BILA|nr:unnamed protein product [Rotaria sordida]